MSQDLRKKIDLLYNGRSKRSIAFRYGQIVFDLVTISFFLATTAFPITTWILVVDYVIVFFLILDYAAQLYIAKNRRRYVLNPISLADLIVIFALLAPTLIENLGFLRVLRALRLLRSYHMLKHLRDEFAFFKRNEKVIASILNLFVFIFMVTALVYVTQDDVNPDITNYVDALYFTITTLTTTGFGDITLHGSSGRLLAIVIMVLGIGLFLRLVQTIFRPAKVPVDCPDCGLKEHEADAIHCKHCGRVLHIETEGA